jgi:hypothetical protein
MPPAGAIMTAAEDDNLGNASKASLGGEGEGEGEGYLKSTRFATALVCAALTLPGLG